VKSLEFFLVSLILAGLLLGGPAALYGQPFGPAAADSAVVESEAVETATPPPGEGVRSLDRAGLTTISPTRAVLATPLFPGWGQLYSENSWRAALAFGVQMFYWSHLLMNDRKAARTQDYSETLAPGPLRQAYGLQTEEYRERVRDFAWWSLGAMLIIALDAYVDAHLFRFDEDPVPIPDRWEQSRLAFDLCGCEAGQPAGVVVFQWRATF
jgi:hypothetical protein